MPTPLKLVLTILVIAVAIAAHMYQAQLAKELNSWLVIGLGMLMIFALWLFPEAKGEKSKGAR